MAIANDASLNWMVVQFHGIPQVLKNLLRWRR